MSYMPSMPPPLRLLCSCLFFPFLPSPWSSFFVFFFFCLFCFTLLLLAAVSLFDNYGPSPTKIEPWEKLAGETQKNIQIVRATHRTMQTCEKRICTSYRVLLRQQALLADLPTHQPKRSRQHLRRQVQGWRPSPVLRPTLRDVQRD